MNRFCRNVRWFSPLFIIILVSVAAGIAGERAQRARRLYDIRMQLTCGGPAGGERTGDPRTVTVDHYRIDDDVWVSIGPSDMAGEEAWLWVVRSEKGEKLVDGETLADASGEVERVVLGDDPGSNHFPVWRAPLVEGEYLVVVDFSPLGSYERGQDLLDGVSASEVGFRVAYPRIDYLRIAPLAGNNVVEGGCTRVQGTGLPQYFENYKAYVWSNGPNGTPEDGGGDDINIGQVAPSWSTDVPSWIGSIDQNGLFESAIDYRCGEGLVFAEYEVFKIGEGTVVLSDTASIAKIPPDWIPMN